ncbi:hypothetical protein DERP_010862 [Dermatophagoides pteronyssinus]|uniref:Allatostatins MIP-like n=1 Tax=Dermatophagoides pteronyssinus TaxID=6956 RepID=A0ABQ8JV49_DERPT|nr:hypothetical protein DERP_010862 [Dermatophagoides pteronyssinus]
MLIDLEYHNGQRKHVQGFQNDNNVVVDDTGIDNDDDVFIVKQQHSIEPLDDDNDYNQDLLPIFIDQLSLVDDYLKHQQQQQQPIDEYSNLWEKRNQWNKFNGAWGKRAANWNKLQSAWGKRLSSPTTTYPKISIETRNWNNLKGAWGRKRMAATAAANNWNQLHGMWGKRRRRTPTWNKMSSAWGKKKRSIGMVAPTHWNKLRGMWGRKRSITSQETMEMLKEQQQPITTTEKSTKQ